jgi:hypothetical protein
MPHLQIYMDAHLVVPDIEAYIRSEVRSNIVLNKVPEAEFIDALVPKSEGMFRWIDCQMDFLRSQLTPRRVRNALKDLPGTLDDTYITLLGRVPEAGKQLVKEALMWLSFCHRPLSVRELCEAVIIEENEREIDEDCRLPDPHLLLSLCQGLILQDEVSGSVTLAHGSIRSFLTGAAVKSSPAVLFALDQEDSARRIFRKCLSYLMLDAFRGGYGLLRTLNVLHDVYPKLDYACKKWTAHAEAVSTEPADLDLIKTFFLTQKQNRYGGNFTFWICCLKPNTPSHSLKASEPLYYAASFGLTSVVEMLLETGLINLSDPGQSWHIDRVCGANSCTALQVACYRGHEDIVDTLLQAGADPHSEDDVGLGCIDWALKRGHYNIAAKLEAAGAKPDYGLDTSQWPHKKTATMKMSRPRRLFDILAYGDACEQRREQWSSLRIAIMALLLT